MLSKVPQVTMYFWIIKVLATTVGETAADFLAVNLGLGLTRTTYVTEGCCSPRWPCNSESRRYIPVVYWIAVVLLSIVGTLITDNLVDNFGVPLEVTTAAFSAALAATFAAGTCVSERFRFNRSIRRAGNSFTGRPSCSFALGTAGGDLLGEGLALGYGWSALLFGGAILAVAIAHFRFGLNAVLAFWAAYVLTRPPRRIGWRPALSAGGKRASALAASRPSLLFPGGDRRVVCISA